MDEFSIAINVLGLVLKYHSVLSGRIEWGANSSLRGEDSMWADFKMNFERVNQQADKQ